MGLKPKPDTPVGTTSTQRPPQRPNSVHRNVHRNVHFSVQIASTATSTQCPLQRPYQRPPQRTPPTNRTSNTPVEQACRNNTSIPYVDHTCRTISKQHVERPRLSEHVVLTHLKKQNVGHLCLTPNIETNGQRCRANMSDALLHERRAFTSDAILYK